MLRFLYAFLISRSVAFFLRPRSYRIQCQQPLNVKFYTVSMLHEPCSSPPQLAPAAPDMQRVWLFGRASCSVVCTATVSDLRRKSGRNDPSEIAVRIIYMKVESEFKVRHPRETVWEVCTKVERGSKIAIKVRELWDTIAVTRNIGDSQPMGARPWHSRLQGSRSLFMRTTPIKNITN